MRPVPIYVSVTVESVRLCAVYGRIDGDLRLEEREDRSFLLTGRLVLRVFATEISLVAVSCYFLA